MLQRTLIITLAFCLVFLTNSKAESKFGDVRLIVRADDIGMSHSANLGCIESYKNGIVKSVELMVPCPWFDEAVTLLNENPGLDVGVHLTLTSEWDNYKWKPITSCDGITDNAGNFLPWVYKTDKAPGMSLMESDWDIKEIEKELRAQIELAIEKVPHISHMSEHMGCLSFSPEAVKLRKVLQEDYNLPLLLDDLEIKKAPRWSGQISSEEKINNLVKMIDSLEPGTYLTIEHPAFNGSDMQNLSNSEDVGARRLGVIDAFTSEKVKASIKKNNVELLSYKDIIDEK